MAKRKPKQPETAVKKGDDDWLSPLIGAAGTIAGAALGGPVGAMVGGAIGSTVGKGAASAAGMEETGVTKALNTASTVGQGVADLAGIMPTGGAEAQPAAPQAPAIPAAAQPGVAIGQDMVAQRVAADGLAQSPMVRSPMAQQIYEAGAYVPPSMAVSQVPEGMKGRAGDLFEPAGSLGFVPERGTLYEATPEAAQRRQHDRLMAENPGYRYDYAMRELDKLNALQGNQNLQFTGIKPRMVEGAADFVEQQKLRAQNAAALNALEGSAYPLYNR